MRSLLTLKTGPPGISKGELGLDNLHSKTSSESPNGRTEDDTRTWLQWIELSNLTLSCCPGAQTGNTVGQHTAKRTEESVTSYPAWIRCLANFQPDQQSFCLISRSAFRPFPAIFHLVFLNIPASPLLTVFQ